MGLEFNSVTIKSPQDLQEALQVQQDSDDFVWQFESMVNRWGLKSALSMLSQALYGDGEKLKPIINITHKFYINPDDYNDYYLVEL